MRINIITRRITVRNNLLRIGIFRGTSELGGRVLWGKPTQRAEVNTTPRSVREMSDEELLAILQEGHAERERMHSQEP
ncbi:MAG TPA: hypothetical protein VF573_29955 [Paraburkholderia sp.]|uniref:hypothetical protein n=1 Tax=Paraburkholderia sp. TaxID=1926495 RepID=UPI002ED11E28